jgi:HEAT repeat protein
MFGPTALPRTLQAALRDVGAEKVQVRASAVRDLVRHGSEARAQVVVALERALRDADARVRSEAAIALADLKASEALPALLVAVEDSDAHVRQMAILALGEIADPRATERLRRALSDKRPEVRFQAVMAFPRVCSDGADAIDALVQASRDDDPLVCHIALRMAEELGSGVDGSVAPEALLDRARDLLRHDSARVRAIAAIVLARIGQGGGDVLAQVALGTLRDLDAEDEATAIELCGVLGIEAARPGLERRAFGGLLGIRRDRFAWHARVALARMGHARATREIMQELSAWDRGRRTLAVAAAGQARILAARGIIESMRGDEGRADPSAVDEALEALSQAEAS